MKKIGEVLGVDILADTEDEDKARKVAKILEEAIKEKYQSAKTNSPKQ